MYAIHKRHYGYWLLFSGFMKEEEMADWVDEARTKLEEPHPKTFGVFVDMRDLKPLDNGANEKMVEGQKLFKEHGMTRSVVILSNPIITMQFRRLAKQSGIYQWERYLDSSTVKDFETVGLSWIERGIDPDHH